ADTSTKDGLNRYAYVSNNPLTLIDPTGHQQGPRDDEPAPLIPYSDIPNLPGAASYQAYQGARLVNKLWDAFDNILSWGSWVSPIGSVGHSAISMGRQDGHSKAMAGFFLGLALIPDVGGLGNARKLEKLDVLARTTAAKFSRGCNNCAAIAADNGHEMIKLGL